MNRQNMWQELIRNKYHARHLTGLIERAHYGQLFHVRPCSCLQSVEIHAAGKARAVELRGKISRLFHFVHQHRHFSAEQVEHCQGHVRCRGDRIVDDGLRVERVGIVLRQREDRRCIAPKALPAEPAAAKNVGGYTYGTLYIDAFIMPIKRRIFDGF